jgi:hypothetical protein
VSGFKLQGDELVEFWRYDLPVGETNARNLFIIRDFLYVWNPTNRGIRVFDIKGNLPVELDSTNPTGPPGLSTLAKFFVYGDYVIVSGWTDNKILLLKLENLLNGNLMAVDSVTTAEAKNVEVMPLGDGSYVVMKYTAVDDTNDNIGRFWIKDDAIVDLNFYNITGLGLSRYATTYNNKVYTEGNFVGKDLLEITFDEVTGVPSETREFVGVSSVAFHGGRIGSFLIGGSNVFDLETETFYKCFDGDFSGGYLKIDDGRIAKLESYGTKPPEASGNDSGPDVRVALQDHPFIGYSQKPAKDSPVISAFGTQGLKIQYTDGRMTIDKEEELPDDSGEMVFPYTFDINITSWGFTSTPSVNASFRINTDSVTSGSTSINMSTGICTANSLKFIFGRYNADFLTTGRAIVTMRLNGFWK